MTMTEAVDPVTAVGSLTSMIRAECANIDKTRALPTAVSSALLDAGVFRLMSPREIGGAEIDPVSFLDIVEETSYADGSVGWCVMIGGCYATIGGLLPAEGARVIYGDPATISAGAFRPNGVAREVEGGYRVTGRWPLGSGSSHANWFVAGCVILRDDRPIIGPTGMPLMREVFFPASVTEIIDTWESTGIGAVPLGIARHALEEFATLAAEKTPALSTTVLAD